MSPEEAGPSDKVTTLYVGWTGQLLPAQDQCGLVSEDHLRAFLCFLRLSPAVEVLNSGKARMTE